MRTKDASLGNCILDFAGGSYEGKFQPDVVEWLGEKLTQLILDARKDKKVSKFQRVTSEP